MDGPLVRPSVIEAAESALQTHHPECRGAFVAGSVMSGVDTPTSDIDIVVLYDRVPNAYQHAVRHGGWPIDFTVHDPATLTWFMAREQVVGVPTLPTMLLDGTLVGDTAFLAPLRVEAERVMALGPAPVPRPWIDERRYRITALRDDLAAPRNAAEGTAIAAQLYALSAELWLRGRGAWSATGKRIPRQLANEDPDFAQRFVAAFDAAFRGDTTTAIPVIDAILATVGGPLAEGYRSDADPSCRVGE